MSRTKTCLLYMMVVMFFVYCCLDVYAWPLSKFAENFMYSVMAIILVLIDPKDLQNAVKGVPSEETKPVDNSDSK